MKPRQQWGFLAPSQQPPAAPVNKFDACFHYTLYDMMHILHVHQIYGDSCKDLWILLTKYKQYYTVSGKSTCPFLGWGTPRPCDLLGCMIAIFSQSTRTQYQATHLPSSGMMNSENDDLWCFMVHYCNLFTFSSNSPAQPWDEEPRERHNLRLRQDCAPGFPAQQGQPGR